MNLRRFLAVCAILTALAILLSSCGGDEGTGPGPGDTTPPAAVSDLAVITTTDSSVALTWTAPGDDGSTGTAAQYDIRYSTSLPVTEGGWSAASPVAAPPIPQAAGTEESLTVVGLVGHTTYYFVSKSADDVGNWSGLSNVVTATPGEQDTIPPATVTDLAVTSRTDSSLTLTWTAPGDDGSTGTAAQYDIRYSTSTITEANWNSASQASGEPVPQPAGSSEGFTVTGLQASTAYYLTLKTADEVPNRCWSGLSNLASATTVGGSVPGEMVLVPAGTFIMGDGVGNCGTDERQVTLTRDFLIGQYEVTNEQYLEAVQWAYDHAYVTATTSSVQDNLDGSTEELLDLDDSDCEIQFGNGIFSLRNAGHGINPDHPVKEVSWYGAVRYCDWLSMQEGLPRAYEHSGDWSCNGGDPYGASGYRLPTDAEWEYAAQYDDERFYPWGSEDPDCTRANFYDNGYSVGWTSPVGNYPGAPSIGGELLYDMAGNVWEWCNDWHTCSLGTSSQTDPTGPGSGSARVLRGGSWGSSENYLRCAARNYYGTPSGTSSDDGFRCVRSQ